MATRGQCFLGFLVFALQARAHYFFKEEKMSLRFEIADWRFELTWDGIGCLPVQSLETSAGLAAAERADSQSYSEETNAAEYIQAEASGGGNLV